MIVKAGIGVFVIACLASCADQRAPVVFDGQTDRAKDNVLECIDKQAVFDRLEYVSVSGLVGGGYADTRSYFLSDGVMLQFIRYSEEIERFRVRANRALTQAERDVLIRCAPFPDNPV